MTVIDFGYLAAHFLWVFGLSVVLAAVSYHTWWLRERGQPIAAQFRMPGWWLAVNVGLALMPLTISVIPRNERWFVRLFALILSMGFASQALRYWLRRNADREIV